MQANRGHNKKDLVMKSKVTFRSPSCQECRLHSIREELEEHEWDDTEGAEAAFDLVRLIERILALPEQHIARLDRNRIGSDAFERSHDDRV